MSIINSGLKNEINIINAINNKTYGELNDNLKLMMNYFCDSFSKILRFKAKKCEKYDKADICITYKSRKYYISLKNGTSSYLHCEYIKTFILFLRKYGISEETQKTLLYYHFGDCTLNGTGKKRYSRNEIIKILGNKISKANLELNSNKELVRDFVIKCIFEGNKDHQQAADYIYHGDENNGVMCSKKQIMNFIMRRNFDTLISPHIGPIIINPYVRYVNFKELHPERRNIVCYNWRNLENNMKNYLNKKY